MKKTVIITGGNSGLGYKTAINIAKHGADWEVIIACRSAERAKQAIKAANMPNIGYRLLDLASLTSVREFAGSIETPIYGLVCNAAGQSDARTEDGFDYTFGVNHLGHFLLTNLLLPQIAENGRIAYVASDMHEPPKMFGKVVYTGAYDLAYPKKDLGMLTYSLSKLCNIYTVYELSRRLQDDNRKITANAFNPGMMNDTGLSREAAGFMAFVNNRVAPLFARIQGRLGSSEASSAALADIITDEKYRGVTGKYTTALVKYQKHLARIGRLVYSGIG